MSGPVFPQVCSGRYTADTMLCQHVPQPWLRRGSADGQHDRDDGGVDGHGDRSGCQSVRQGRGADGLRRPVQPGAPDHRRERHQPADRRLPRHPPDRRERRRHRHRHAEEHRLRHGADRRHHLAGGVRAAPRAELRGQVRPGHRRPDGRRAVFLGPHLDLVRAARSRVLQGHRRNPHHRGPQGRRRGDGDLRADRPGGAEVDRAASSGASPTWNTPRWWRPTTASWRPR